MKVRTDFEGGRIELVHSEPQLVVLRIPADVGAPIYRQHFAFDLVGAQSSEPIELRIENAGECSWGDAFGGLYRVYASHHSGRWFRVETRFEDGALHFWHAPRAPRVRFAYHPQYPAKRLGRLLDRVRAGGAGCSVLAQTPGGRPVHHLSFGAGRRDVPELWVIAQQHPAETMAGWFVEGMVEALLADLRRAQEERPSRQTLRRSTPREPAARQLAAGGGSAAADLPPLLSQATVHVVPRMNPDGVAAGNHRTTPRGVDLNRAWSNPGAAIEVGAVRQAMERVGVDFLLDVHGDERLPWVFMQPADWYSGRSAAIARASKQLEEALLACSSDFQTLHRYPYDPHGHPNTQLASNWAQHHFGCLALTLEMPFSDNADAPDARGWHPARSKQLGRAMVATFAQLVATRQWPPRFMGAEVLGAQARWR